MRERKLHLTCIVCPVGCELKVSLRGRNDIFVKGGRCRRGVSYAREEIDPKRTLISVVKVKGGELPVVSVKTSMPIPKELIPKAIDYLATIELDAPLSAGHIVTKDLLGLGVPVVTTRECK